MKDLEPWKKNKKLLENDRQLKRRFNNEKTPYVSSNRQFLNWVISEIKKLFDFSPRCSGSCRCKK